MSADGMIFGLAISKARKAIGLSQKEFAARVMKLWGTCRSVLRRAASP